jgi:hypothetical protein
MVLSVGRGWSLAEGWGKVSASLPERKKALSGSDWLLSSSEKSQGFQAAATMINIKLGQTRNRYVLTGKNE